MTQCTPAHQVNVPTALGRLSSLVWLSAVALLCYAGVAAMWQLKPSLSAVNNQPRASGAFSTLTAGVPQTDTLTETVWLPVVYKDWCAARVRNGDFEMGPQIWTPTNQIVTSGWTGAHSGNWYAELFGGSLQQSLLCPIDSSEPYLAFWYWASEHGTARVQELHINVNGVTVDILNLKLPPWQKWIQKTTDLRPYIGQTVSIEFEWVCDRFGFVSLDDIGFQSNWVVPPPPWP